MKPKLGGVQTILPIAALKEMRPYMDEDEKALKDMTDAVPEKLGRMTDEQYSKLMTNIYCYAFFTVAPTVEQ